MAGGKRKATRRKSSDTTQADEEPVKKRHRPSSQHSRNRPTPQPVRKKGSKDSKEAKKQRTNPSPERKKPSTRSASAEKRAKAAPPQATTPPTENPPPAPTTSTREKQAELSDPNKDTEVDRSSMSSTSYHATPAPTILTPPSVNDRCFRRVIFACAGESDGNGLTKPGEEMASRAAAALRPTSIYFSGVIMAPTLACLRMGRLISDALGPDSVRRENMCVEPGLLDAFDRLKGVADDERTFLPPASENPRLAYHQFTTRAEVKKERQHAQFETRVSSAIKHIVQAQYGSLLVVLDPAPLDAAVRALLQLPSHTARDYGRINGSPSTPPAIPHGSLAIVEQINMFSTWELRHRFDDLQGANGQKYGIDIDFLRRTT